MPPIRHFYSPYLLSKKTSRILYSNFKYFLICLCRGCVNSNCLTNFTIDQCFANWGIHCLIKPFWGLLSVEPIIWYSTSSSNSSSYNLTWQPIDTLLVSIFFFAYNNAYHAISFQVLIFHVQAWLVHFLQHHILHFRINLQIPLASPICFEISGLLTFL